jgi:methylated-DNA-[protein]-cysteine S-methyltransferase
MRPVRESSYFSFVASPIGELLLVSNGHALTGVSMEPPGGWSGQPRPGPRDDALLRPAREQLRAYFAGELLDFDLHLAAAGTPFQQRVWRALRAIPYGDTASYADVAREIGNPTATRAVGAANGRNPIAIIVPCHRVIGKDGSLTGYGGGLARKQWLLRHEIEVLARRSAKARPSRQGRSQLVSSLF